MAPFRWPTVYHDLALAKEVAERKPETPQEWEQVALVLSKAFTSSSDKVIEVEIKGRGCRERMQRLLDKHQENDKKALKKSGSEEEYTELSQLIEDIATYRRDIKEVKAKKSKEREQKKNKENEDKKAGIEMRQKAMEGLSKRKQSETQSSEDEHLSEDDDWEPTTSTSGKGAGKGTKTKTPRKKATRLTAVQMIEEKNKTKAILKERELQIREGELKLQKERFEEEAAERREKLQMELEERRMFLQLLKDKL